MVLDLSGGIMERLRQRRRSGIIVTVATLILGLSSALPARAAGPDPGARQGSGSRPAPSASHVPGQLLVRYHPGTTAEERAAAEAGAGASPRSAIEALDVRILTVPPERAEEALASLTRNRHVDFAELDGIAEATAVTPNDPGWSKQWGAVKTATNAAWDTTTGSSSVVIAELDTGVDFAHPDLQGAFVAGYDFVNRDTSPTDDNGHGTMVAGLLAARTNNGVGIAGQCWKCVIMPVKVLSSSGSGSYSTVASGITWATDHGARIINMSLGGASASSTLQSAVSYAWSKGALVIAAAGNNGTTALNYPAAYDPAIAVAGSDSRDGRYSWSSYGSWVELAAPGCDYTTARGGGYSTPCGTSFSSPMTAGIAGLLAAANPGASNVALRDALLATADPVGSWVSHGRVNAAKAVAAIGGSTAVPNPGTVEPVTSTFSGNLSPKQTTRSYTVSAGGGAFSASLSFTRASNLTLTVRNAAGATVATASGPSVLKLSGSLTAGTYTFVVSGTQKTSFTLGVTHATP
jgi:subtilisin family serine protease